MAIKHKKISGISDGANSALVQPSDWNNDHAIDADGLVIPARTDQPATPAAGNLTLFAHSVASGYLPSIVPPAGQVMELQPFIGRNKIMLMLPQNGSATITQIGGAFNALGTATARSVATTSYFTMARRIGYVTAATINSRAMIYGPAVFQLSSTAGLGGFRFACRFGISDATFTSACNMFVGMSASSAVGTSTIVSNTNIIGVGAETTDTNLQLFTNAGTGTATKTDLGISFPANTAGTDWYELILFAASGTTGSVGYRLVRLNTGDTAQGTVTANTPAAGTLLLPMAMRGNVSNAVAVGLDIGVVYVGSDNG